MPATSHRPLVLAALLVSTAAPLGAETAHRLTDLRPGSDSGVATLDAAILDGKLYFRATDHGGAFADLWVYDGAAPPAVIPGGESVDPSDLVAFQGVLYFAGSPATDPGDRELWRYDGLQPPAEVFDLHPTDSSLVSQLTVVGDELCFHARTPAAGPELVCWDGGVASQPVVHDLWSGTSGSAPSDLAAVGGSLYFAASTPGIGREPWVYDGAGAPTLLDDVTAGGGSSTPSDFALVGTTLFFRASDAGGVARVWRFDEISGEALVDIPDLDVDGGLTPFRGLLFVGGTSPASGISQLHTWDGATLRVLASDTGVAFAAQSFLVHDDALFFIADGGATTSSDLFRYCGGESLMRVTNAFAGTEYVSPDLVLFDGSLWFAAHEAATGGELWWIDPWRWLLCDGFGSGDTTGWLP